MSVSDEVIENYMLDDGESNFSKRFPGISAAEASAPVSSNGSAISAQVNHTRFYLDALLDLVRTGEQRSLDWESSWQVREVDETAWQELVADLRRAYDEVRALADSFDQWNLYTIGGAFGIVGITACQFGQVREGIGRG
ncbi:MAG: hypothetical protein R2839_03765 [Thermomicrobiales bacterium]